MNVAYRSHPDEIAALIARDGAEFEGVMRCGVCIDMEFECPDCKLDQKALVPPPYARIGYCWCHGAWNPEHDPEAA